MNVSKDYGTLPRETKTRPVGEYDDSEADCGRNRSQHKQLLAGFLASLMSFSSGTVIAGWTPPNGRRTDDDDLKQFDPEQESWVVSIYIFGALIGALPAGALSHKYGRKTFLLWLALPMTAGWTICSLRLSSLAMECAGRFLCGLSLGATTVAVPLYASDVSSDVLRGRTGVFLDFMLCAGIEYAYVARTVVSGLRRFCAWSAAVPLVFVLLFSYMPESPIYLFNEGRHKEAATALRWLRGRRFDVQKEFDRIEKSRWNDDMAKGINVMNGKNNRKFLKKVLIISFGLVLAQRLSGAGGVIQYSNTLFKLSGAAIEPSTACIIVGAFQVAASGLSFLLIDKVGRRTLLLISSGLVTVCLALLIFYFGLLERNLLPTDSPWKMTVLLVLCTFISAFRLGLGPIPWFISIELMPDAYRDRIQSVTASFSWFLSFVIMKTFKVLVESHPVEVWCSYAAFSAVGFVFILACVPETNNKSNEQILSDLTD